MKNTLLVAVLIACFLSTVAAQNDDVGIGQYGPDLGGTGLPPVSGGDGVGEMEGVAAVHFLGPAPDGSPTFLIVAWSDGQTGGLPYLGPDFGGSIPAAQKNETDPGGGIPTTGPDVGGVIHAAPDLGTGILAPDLGGGILAPDLGGSGQLATELFFVTVGTSPDGTGQVTVSAAQAATAGTGTGCFSFPNKYLPVQFIDTNGKGKTLSAAVADHKAKLANIAAQGGVPCK